MRIKRQLDFFKPFSAGSTEASAVATNAKRLRKAREGSEGVRVVRVQSEFVAREMSYGGDPVNRRSKRKVVRPLDRKKPVHLVLKSTHAIGRMSFLTPANRVAIEGLIRERARQFGVKIHGREIMKNHIHIVASFVNRKAFQNFLRTVAALIARKLTGARKGHPFRKDGARFFNHILFSRVVQSFADLKRMQCYLNKNAVERELGVNARNLIEEYESWLRQMRRLARPEARRAAISRLRPARD